MSSSVHHELSNASCPGCLLDVSSNPPPLRIASHGEATPSTFNSRHLHDSVTHNLDSIRRELEELKLRRERLESQRKELLEGKRGTFEVQRMDPVSSSASGRTGPARSNSTPGVTTTRARSEMDSLAASSALHASHERRGNLTYQDSLMLANMKPILSENERRRILKATPYVAMKNALRDALQNDSTAIMGDFLLEDNPRACTFGRERRFRPLLDYKGRYFLSTDSALGECINRGRGHVTTFKRELGNTSQTPGPGAYTPRYNKLSRPPRTY
ncbi:hypothetical protein JKF63_01960 [Porcisia hertigi]|uniref:Uncharacterized protein n=1 Tax=Porcisia hertigi TaxID=2761500 RepID=A0A836IF97_9TRYP|nr:hypothetical protein JKF63_01960 [Porcisia hertigi]